ncbi:hypothetical protein EJ110_NYTH45681 [Nymphaea thermarum]|nr:hypothetical protein EJ110_NYTH45681 [Nymphaea thermarum]
MMATVRHNSLCQMRRGGIRKGAGGDEGTFSTLLYADDFLLFGTASRQHVRTLLILRVFELISGLSINSSKCHISLIHVDPATVLLAEACFGCKAAGLPMKYLGFQITLSPSAPSFWDEVGQKLVNRLQCWQEILFSLPGRITLAKHCLASVPLHALAVFRPLGAVLNRKMFILPFSCGVVIFLRLGDDVVGPARAGLGRAS